MSHMSRTLPSVLVFLFGGCYSHTPPTDPLAPFGLHYALHVAQEPRPLRVHVLRADLSNRRIALRSVLSPDPDGPGRATASLWDPREMVKDKPVIAYVNANPWDALPDPQGARNRQWRLGQPVEITGLAASAGQIRSPPDLRLPSLWLDSRGRVHIGYPSPDADIVEGWGGFQVILRNGEILPRQEDERLNPLTGIGTNPDGRILWLVVVDGRQPGISEGMTSRELAEFMKQLGARDAIRMDGGGSSIMAARSANGSLAILNSPSDRAFGIPFIRPLPNLLTIQEK